MESKYRRMALIFVNLLGMKNNKRFEDKYFIYRLFHEEVKKNEKRNPDHVTLNRRVYSFFDYTYFFYNIIRTKMTTTVEMTI